VSVFDGIAGQARAIVALERQLARFGGAGSTLIVGPEGVGRFTLAHRAAIAILGDRPQVEAFTHPDLTLLEPEAGIDGVRGAAEALARRPARAPRQVLLVRDADRFSGEAHNALLKTLEEPPGEAGIFLTAADLTLLPETVVSRCRVVRARALDDAETARVLAARGAPVEGAADAEGSPGRALYHAAHGVGEQAAALVALLDGQAEDPLGEVERLVRRRKEEETAAFRRRLVEVGRVAAARLRRRLPESENRLRALVECLGSLGRNANPGIALADLALIPWKRTNP